MKVIGYVRVSTEQQELTGLSLDAQQDKITKYCDTYDLELVSLVVETASGKSLDRPLLRKSLDRISHGEAEGLVIMKLDRLTRSVSDLGYLLSKFFAKNRLISVSEQLDTMSAGGRLMLNLLVSVSQWEREVISERTKLALDHKRSLGEYAGGQIPWGTRLSADGVHLEPHEAEQRSFSLAKIWKSQGLSLRKIAARLAEEGITSREGKIISATMVQKLVL